jgi:hypothetical protein
MPYHLVWEPAPKDESLTVFKELPDGYEKHSLSIFGFDEVHKGLNTMYFCYHCNGWIEDYPNTFSINTLNSSRLAGRCGTEFFCRRCGKEIGFIGMMS